MRRYPLLLDSEAKLEKYCALVVRFPFRGFVRCGAGCWPREDVPEIWRNCRCRAVELCVSCAGDDEISDLEHFLRAEDLLYREKKGER